MDICLDTLGIVWVSVRTVSCFEALGVYWVRKHEVMSGCETLIDLMVTCSSPQVGCCSSSELFDTSVRDFQFESVCFQPVDIIVLSSEHDVTTHVGFYD